MWTQIRPLLEQSDLILHCLLQRRLNGLADDAADVSLTCFTGYFRVALPVMMTRKGWLTFFCLLKIVDFFNS